MVGVNPTSCVSKAETAYHVISFATELTIATTNQTKLFTLVQTAQTKVIQFSSVYLQYVEVLRYTCNTSIIGIFLHLDQKVLLFPGLN